VCIFALGSHLLPQKSQEEVSQALGIQSLGIERVIILDEFVVLEDPGDGHKVVLSKTVVGDSAKQQEFLERRVRCRRGIHAPDSTPRGTEGAARVLDKVNWRHDLRVPTLSATLCRVRRPRCAKHIPAARALALINLGDGKSIASIGGIRPGVLVWVRPIASARGDFGRFFFAVAVLVRHVIKWVFIVDLPLVMGAVRCFEGCCWG
jgi:hypothetical protein